MRSTKSYIVAVRFTHKDYNKIKKIAKANFLSPSTWIRKKILEILNLIDKK